MRKTWAAENPVDSAPSTSCCVGAGAAAAVQKAVTRPIPTTADADSHHVDRRDRALIHSEAKAPPNDARGDSACRGLVAVIGCLRSLRAPGLPSLRTPGR